MATMATIENIAMLLLPEPSLTITGRSCMGSTLLKFPYGSGKHRRFAPRIFDRLGNLQLGVPVERRPKPLGAAVDSDQKSVCASE
jgi:hypothetical protein